MKIKAAVFVGLGNPAKIQEIIEILRRNDEETTDTVLAVAQDG